MNVSEITSLLHEMTGFLVALTGAIGALAPLLKRKKKAGKKTSKKK